MPSTVSSETQICNLALHELGNRGITSLNDGTATSDACLLLYGPTRDAVLRSHFWKFAKTRVALAADSDTPAFEWSLQYTLPSDFVRVRRIFGQSGPYEIENGKLLTDMSAPLNLIYIRLVEDVEQFDALFVQYLVLELALALAKKINGASYNVNDIFQKLQKIRLEAKMVDSQDSGPEPWDISHYSDARTEFVPFPGTISVREVIE